MHLGRFVKEGLIFWNDMLYFCTILDLRKISYSHCHEVILT